MLREGGADTGGLRLGVPSSAISAFDATTTDDNGARRLVYGGYRWRNDVAVEASFNSTDPTDPYVLRPPRLGVRSGMGLVPAAGSLGLTDNRAARSWNLDVYTSWNFYRAFALYGRLGYAQTDTAPLFGTNGINLAPDSRRVRDGMNYGVGVRYDMTSALGLRLEYGRFGRFAGEAGSTPLESDQVTLGLQFRF